MTSVLNKVVFVPGRPFQPSLMFVSKDKAYTNRPHFMRSSHG
jgi:hypothetical protein